MKTQSEKWFEDFCMNSGIECKRIEEEEGKTPDYKLTINNQTIICEVKEISRNRNEQESDRLLKERGYGSLITNTPGERVRKKISDSSPQIKARTQSFFPSILVLCDLKFCRGKITGHLDPYNVRVGMYGLEQMHIAIPNDYSFSPYATGIRYGPKRKMTENHNTSISAIGVLSTPNQNKIILTIYHNKFAAIPLDPHLVSKHNIEQFRLGNSVPSKTAEWEKI